MLTLTQNPAGLDPATLRYTALLAIAVEITPAKLRTRSAGTPQAAADRQIADEVDYLSARGVTGRAASRALAERDRRLNPGRQHRPYSEQDARQAAGIYLADGMTSGALRADTALRGTPGTRRMFAMVADAMDALLAEGFDPAAYKQQLEARGGAR